MSDRSSKINAVFYANSYHPIQAGSIDGTDILPHDNAVYRALLCSSAGLYDPHGDPNTVGDPYCSLFVGQLSHLTNEDTLRKAMSRYGRVKNLRLVRHIVTGASRGYAFVEYETQRELRRAYEDAHHSFIDDTEIIVDYNRQQLMPGWIPRRLGGGLGGRKESGQLRFGGRERPFRAPLRPIPWDDLKRLGIPPPPEGHYMSRHEIPPPPRRRGASSDEDSPRKRRRSEESMEPPPRRHSRVESSGRQRLSVHRHEGRHGRDDQPGGRWHCADSYDERHAREQLPTGRWHPADDQEERHSPALSPAARRRRSTDNSEEESPVRKRSSVDKHQGSSRRRHKHGREHSGTSSRSSSRSFRERRQEST